MTEQEISQLQTLFQQGSKKAAEAMTVWCGRAFRIHLDALRCVPLEEATQVLHAGDDPLCFCSVAAEGVISGQMVLAFDDVSGLKLAALLTDRAAEQIVAWDELSTAAMLETANILCCAYLNALFEALDASGSATGLMPSPPRFSREYAESAVEFLVMGQALEFDQVLIACTRFMIEDSFLNCSLLFVPDSQTMAALPGLLSAFTES